MSKKSLWFVLIVFLAACGEAEETKTKTKSPRIRKKSVLVKPTTNQKISFGEQIVFEIEKREEGSLAIDSFQVKGLGENLWFTGNTGSFTPENPKSGSPKINITVYFGTEKESLYPKVTLLPSQPPTRYTYKVINTFPHAEDAYIQGFLVKDNYFLESTGRRGSSTLRKVVPESGEVARNLNLQSEYFGEGLAIWDEKLYQLTWTSQIGFIYDLEFNPLGTFNYTSQGWGLTTYGDQLIMSDGTENLYLINPEGFTTNEKLEVYNNEEKVSNLNELEMVEDMLFANVYGEEYVVIIDPETGAVRGQIDFTGLRAQATNKPGADYVLNGIAYDEKEKRLFVTGKLWPYVFEVSLIEKAEI